MRGTTWQGSLGWWRGKSEPAQGANPQSRNGTGLKKETHKIGTGVRKWTSSNEQCQSLTKMVTTAIRLTCWPEKELHVLVAELFCIFP